MTTDTAGHYSLIQYQPSIERAEGVNVGVVLVCDGLDPPCHVMMSESSNLARRRFPDHMIDVERIQSAKAALAVRLRRLTSFDDLCLFYEREAGNLVVMPPRIVVVTDPRATIVELFADLVEEVKVQ